MSRDSRERLLRRTGDGDLAAARALLARARRGADHAAARRAERLLLTPTLATLADGRLAPTRHQVDHCEPDYLFLTGVFVGPGAHHAVALDVTADGQNTRATAWLWDAARDARQVVADDASIFIPQVAFAPCGSHLYVPLAWEAGLREVDLRHIPPGVRDLPGCEGCQAVAVSSDGAWLAIGTERGEVRLWRRDERGALTAERTIDTGAVQICALAFSPDGRHLALTSQGDSVQLWHIADGTLERSLACDESILYLVRFSRDGELVASSGGSGALHVWRVADGQRVLHAQLNATRELFAFDFSPHASLIVAGDDEGRLRFFDLDSAECVAQLTLAPPSPHEDEDGEGVWQDEPHAGLVSSVCWLAEPHRLVAASETGRIEVWSLEQ